MRKILVIFSLLLSLTVLGTKTDAAYVHTVKQGDTWWLLANHNGVPVNTLKNINNRVSDTLYVGEKINIPDPISTYERDLLARLVTAEAKGEPYAGQVAVALVVLNRVDSNEFPNSIHGVITQVSNGYHAFSPVKNGQIQKPATTTAKKAVNEAIAMRGQGRGSLFFYNPATASNHWIATRDKTITIGNHVFAK